MKTVRCMYRIEQVILGLHGRYVLLAQLQFDEFWYDSSLKANLLLQKANKKTKQKFMSILCFLRDFSTLKTFY